MALGNQFLLNCISYIRVHLVLCFLYTDVIIKIACPVMFDHFVSGSV